MRAVKGALQPKIATMRVKLMMKRARVVAMIKV
jgi:hypothetical protein